ncbi:hypothetical protein EDD41_2721 [Luteococcus japonicus]|uniref:Uncharacterized protein n=1 Tax=Luteococcus japonicus TaxID=33984 RepID=A0A3N1ZY96_9ACTN|nr:hypothetical protein EDD41_2721 [Luteococcus japonicus]
MPVLGSKGSTKRGSFVASGVSVRHGRDVPSCTLGTLSARPPLGGLCTPHLLVFCVLALPCLARPASSSIRSWVSRFRTRPAARWHPTSSRSTSNCVARPGVLHHLTAYTSGHRQLALSLSRPRGPSSHRTATAPTPSAIRSRSCTRPSAATSDIQRQRTITPCLCGTGAAQPCPALLAPCRPVPVVLHGGVELHSPEVAHCLGIFGDSPALWMAGDNQFLMLGCAHQTTTL